jgi:hypothetical protein
MTPNGKKDVLTECLEAVRKDMLSVGSGDGSQQVSMIKAGLKRLQVTFYDSRETVLLKYPNAKDNLDFLHNECEIPPRYQVDATKIEKLYNPKSFDLIFFTFPHNGISNNSTMNVSSNQALLQGFLRAASNLVRPEGEIQLTLKNGEHYERWKLPDLLEQEAGLQLSSTHKFDQTMFPGYKHRLTNGTAGSMKVVPHKKGAKVYVFSSKTTYPKKNDSISSNLFHGKLVTVVQLTNQSWTDEELWAETVAVLRGFQAPRNVLEIRRQLDPSPETRQLNRVVYAMEKEGIVKRHAPPVSAKSQKPRWYLASK